jgi:hypothetical protein
MSKNQSRTARFWKHEWEKFSEAMNRQAQRDRRRRLGRWHLIQYSGLAAVFVVSLITEGYLLATAVGVLLLMEVIEMMDELRELRGRIAGEDTRNPHPGQNTGNPSA